LDDVRRRRLSHPGAVWYAWRRTISREFAIGALVRATCSATGIKVIRYLFAMYREPGKTYLTKEMQKQSTSLDRIDTPATIRSRIQN
jgi:hypothetical protein